MIGILFRLQGTEAKLEGIVAEQGSNVSSLVALVKENGEIIAAMDVRIFGYFVDGTDLFPSYSF